MFKTIGAQIAMYKWTIIICLFAVLTIGLVWQYHKADALETQTEQLEADKEALEGKVDGITNSFNTFKADTDKALAELATLRTDIAKINNDSAALRSRVDGLGVKSAKPLPGGANYKEIENEANAFTSDVFQRIEDASKGKMPQ